MKNSIKLLMLSISIFTTLLLAPIVSNAATSVIDEETLISAISSADYGATITLQNNITVSQPIVIAKELTIDGNGHTLTGSSNWTSTSGNQTMFTAQFSDAKVTLRDINLVNGPKYGVQSYDGATIILDNVSITGFNYGGVLLNGGNVEVKKLHLGYNGTGANNGIEIDKGAAATNNPTLVMNGILTSDTNENVVRVAENGYLTEFNVTNTSNTNNKVFVAGDKVVLTDSNNNVISETEIPDKVTSNTAEQKAVITLIADTQTKKIVVDIGKTITADLLKEHIELEDKHKIEGFFTDDKYTKKFDFNKPIKEDITIYAKISEIQENVVSETTKGEKDDVPKTGIQNNLGIALATIIFSIIGIIYIKKNIKE